MSFIHLLLFDLEEGSSIETAVVVHLFAHLPSHICSQPMLFCCTTRGRYFKGTCWGSTERFLEVELLSPLQRMDEMPLSIEVELEMELNLCRSDRFVLDVYSSHERK